jgi:hypothetical protein
MVTAAKCHRNRLMFWCIVFIFAHKVHPHKYTYRQACCIRKCLHAKYVSLWFTALCVYVSQGKHLWHLPHTAERNSFALLNFISIYVTVDRLCGLVVRVLGYRFGGPGSIPGTTRFSDKKKKKGKQVVGLERGSLSLVSTTEKLLDRKVAAPV